MIGGFFEYNVGIDLLSLQFNLLIESSEGVLGSKLFKLCCNYFPLCEWLLAFLLVEVVPVIVTESRRPLGEEP